MRSQARRLGVIFRADLKADWLLSNLHDLTDRKNERNRPLLSAICVPIRRHLGSEREGRLRFECVSEERLAIS